MSCQEYAGRDHSMRLDNKTFYSEANFKYLVAIIDKNKSKLGYIHEK
jgi:hypothetical protein